MPYDTLVMTAVAAEISQAIGARVTRIHQPRAQDVAIRLRKPGLDRALLLSASPGASRVHFTDAAGENPKFPPMFCMLLRKHLEGARLSGVEQAPHERILFLRFEGRDDMGVPRDYSIIAEIMGRRSNIILVDESRTVVDAVRRAALDVNQAREVMPGRPYSPPPSRPRVDPSLLSAESLAAWISADPSKSVGDVLVERVAALSPALARHAVSMASRTVAERLPGAAPPVHDLAVSVVEVLRSLLQPGAAPRFSPIVYWDGVRPIDYYCFPLDHLHGVSAQAFATMSEALDAFYRAKLEADRFQSLAQSLRSAVRRALERAASRLESQRLDLAEGMKADQYRLFGELLTAYGKDLPRSSEARLPNYYVDGSPEVVIPLDPSLDAHANARVYFKKYAKAKAAREQAGAREARTLEEIAYLEQVAETIDQAAEEQHLLEIRDELAGEGYLPRADHDRPALPGRPCGAAGPRDRVGGSPRSGANTASIVARSSEGFEILVGRNNRQNDILWRNAKPDDIWLHSKNMPGAHVILRYSREAGKPPEAWPPEKSLLEAAALAAYYSKGRNNAKVQVDYTLARHVWKPKGAKPGMVLYDHERTLVVQPAPAAPA